MPEAADNQNGRTVPPAAQIRDASKWMIGAFGGVAAVVAASIQFGDIGRLSGADLLLALAGALAAFAGISISIYAIANLLLPQARTLADLTGAAADDPAVEWLHRNPDILVPFSTLEELSQARREGQELYAAAFRNWSLAPTPGNARDLKSAAELLRPIDEVTSRIIDWANYQTLHAEFARTLRRRVALGTLLAACGLTLFAYRLSGQDASVQPAAPTEALVSRNSPHP